MYNVHCTLCNSLQIAQVSRGCEDMEATNRIVYIESQFDLTPFPLLMCYFTFMQVTRLIVIHTRDSIEQYYQRNSYTISLG
jgi:hypothetical protein